MFAKGLFGNRLLTHLAVEHYMQGVTLGRLSTQLGQRVTLAYRQKQFTGNCIGVDPEKGLILQLDRGGVRIFDAAHTHIVK